jgi:tetrahydromethanopterin S-methyltransferase subunit A
MKKLMHFIATLFPNSKNGENSKAVKMYYNIQRVKDFLKNKKKFTKKNWPIETGNYKVINTKGEIAVCALTSTNLQDSISINKNVAIIGNLFTPNLGVEKIIINVISNPHIRFLVLCGKDSPIFQAGQAIQSLFKFGINSEKRIINATGSFPVLNNISVEKINLFLKQVELIDCIDEKEIEFIHQKINEIELKNEKFDSSELLINEPAIIEKESFLKLKPTGKRIPLDYDKNGFFVISIDRNKMVIIVKHYYKNNQPGHLITGRSSEKILLTILEHNLVSQMSHAGYLGNELGKAKTALNLNLNYVQDQPLKSYNVTS